MKSCITGVSGFVASHLATYLLEQGETVIGTFRWNEDLSRIEHLKDKVVMVPMDLLDLPSCIRCIEEHRPDYIYHLAAQSYVPDSYIYPVQTIMTNTIGTLNLLEAVREERDTPYRFPLSTVAYYDPTIGVCSSSEVYGQVDKTEIPIKETQPFRPQNPYGVGKAGADLLGYMYWKCYDLKIIRMRPFTHTGYGRTMPSFESSVAHQIALIEKRLQEPVVKVGYLDSMRTIADVRDVVRAYYLMMRKCRPGEVYNIGGDNVMKVGDVVDYLIALSPMKDKIKIEVDPKLLRPADVPLQIVDTSKFREETGWKPEISFECTMADLLSFWRERV